MEAPEKHQTPSWRLVKITFACFPSFLWLVGHGEYLLQYVDNDNAINALKTVVLGYTLHASVIDTLTQVGEGPAIG